MFRGMRRSKQELSLEETLDIVKKGKTGVLAVLGDEGYPYTVPINFVYEDNKLYFHGAKTGHKIDSIKSCGKVSLCVVERDDVVEAELTTYFRSAVVFGRARVLEGDEEIAHAARLLGLKYGGDGPAVEQEIEKVWKALCCVEIVIEHITGKEAIELTRARADGHS